MKYKVIDTNDWLMFAERKRPYLTKYWFGRWWWYAHTKKKHPLRVLRIGRFYTGRTSYKITNRQAG